MGTARWPKTKGTTRAAGRFPTGSKAAGKSSIWFWMAVDVKGHAMVSMRRIARATRAAWFMGEADGDGILPLRESEGDRGPVSGRERLQETRARRPYRFGLTGGRGDLGRRR
jgi:hypothetical protein